jgi:predicted double-glycine peptidase
MLRSDYLAIQEQRAASGEIQTDLSSSSGTFRSLFSSHASLSYYTSHAGAFHHPVAIGMLGENVALEDGSVWSIYSGHRHKTLDWLSTDTVLIAQNKAWFSSYQYCLYNQNTEASVEADLTLGPIHNGTLTHYIVAIDYKEKYVWLEDGSKWEISSGDATALTKWLVNDTVIIGVNDAFFALFTPNILINVTYSTTYVHAKCQN